MEFISVFDVIGPNMIGPSSSHTAGAVSIALLANKLFPHKITKVTFTLYGSFAKTYEGHGTNKALLGGVLGYSPDDVRIRDAFEIADSQGLEHQWIIEEQLHVNHPNTVDIKLESSDGSIQEVRGESVGGGKVRIVRINNIDVDFTGEYSTLIIKQMDKPGTVAHITQCLSHQNVNIAFMRLFREDKGATAYTIVESDEKIPKSILSEIHDYPHIHELMLIQI